MWFCELFSTKIKLSLIASLNRMRRGQGLNQCVSTENKTSQRPSPPRLSLPGTSFWRARHRPPRRGPFGHGVPAPFSPASRSPKLWFFMWCFWFRSWGKKKKVFGWKKRSLNQFSSSFINEFTNCIALPPNGSLDWTPNSTLERVIGRLVRCLFYR